MSRDPLSTLVRAALLCAALLVPAPALAQNQLQSPVITPTESGLEVTLSGHRMTIPPPSWTVPSEEPVPQAQTRFTTLGPGVESLVLMPPSATVVTWRELMGVLAVNRPGYRAEAQLASVVDPITEACAPGQLEMSSVSRDGGGAILLLCGRYRLDAADVPSRCGGGIMLATIIESTAGAAKVYHEWCTDAFDASKPDTWPVTELNLAVQAEALIALSSFVPVEAPAE